MTLPLVLLAGLALAQPPVACPDGKVNGPDTQGHCCWADQVWSGSRKTCVGIPRCPVGLTAQGEECKLVCPTGLEVGADTQGHCCWPSQVWSGTRQSCVGIPTCSEGLIASGEMCVPAGKPQPAPELAPVPPPPPERTTAPPPPPARSDAPQAVAPAPSPLAPPATLADDQLIDGVHVPAGHHLEKRARIGLLIPGVVLLGAGWLASVLVSVGSGIYVAFKPNNTCWGFASSVAWIPLIGAPVAIAGQGDPSLRSDGGKHCVDEQPWFGVGTAVAVVDTIMQWGGLTMMILGLTVRQSVVVPDNPEAPTAAVAPPVEFFVNVGAKGSPFGLTLGLNTP